MDQLEETHHLIFATQAWLLWFRRNKGRIDNIWDDIGSIRTCASLIIQDYQKHQPPLDYFPPPRPYTKWTLPEEEMWKINFDCAVFQDSATAGVGVVVRNNHGRAMAALAQILPLPHAPVDIEALATRTTMTLAVELHLDRVLFEGDSKIIINALQSSEASCTSYGHLISET